MVEVAVSGTGVIVGLGVEVGGLVGVGWVGVPGGHGLWLSTNWPDQLE